MHVDPLAPHHHHQGAFRSSTVVARCQCCEQSASTYCGTCGRTLCPAHGPVDGLCPQCRGYFDAELNRKQGRGLEGLGIIVASFLLWGLGLVGGAELLASRSAWLIAGGWLVLVLAGLSPIWLLLGRQWLAKRLFRRLR